MRRRAVPPPDTLTGMPALSRSILTLALLGAAAPTPLAHAQGAPAPAPATPLGCADWLTLEPGNLRAARVSVSRAVFTDASGKPGKAYVVKGDLLLQGPPVNGRRCSYFVRGGVPTGAGGYLNTMQVQNLPASAALSGTWTSGSGTLTLTKTAAGAWQVQGSALYPTPGGSANLGEVDGTLTRRGGAWQVAADGCELNLWPVGPWLVAADNGACGGLNVTFSGLYARQR